MRCLIAGLLLGLGGCASFSALLPGSSTGDEVIAKFGQPAGRRALAGGGEVLDYPREPAGLQNWRVTLSAEGRVRSVEQLVDEPYFAKIRPGMSRGEVLLTLGVISEERAYPNLQETVLSWRYRDFGSRLMFFNAHFDSSGILKYASRSIDPITHTGGRTR